MDLKNYFPLFLEKKILLSEIGIHPRTFMAWKESGITFYEGDQNVYINKSEKRKWVYLDVFEAVWLLMIVELRKFNLDLKTIKKIKEFLRKQIDFKSILDNISEEDFQNKLVDKLSEEQLESIGGYTTKEKLLGSLPTNDYTDTFLTNFTNTCFALSNRLKKKR